MENWPRLPGRGDDIYTADHPLTKRETPVYINQRLVAFIGAMAVVTLVPLTGQTPPSATKAASPKAWTLPRTVDGQPDLEGVWNFSTLTPLQRPREFAGRQAMTDEEASELERRYLEQINTDRRDGTLEADLARNYNEFWWDRRKQVATVNGIKRTSLIVDPPDGRIPALTPEGQQRIAARNNARTQHPADGPEDLDLSERCLLLNAGPPMLANGNRPHYVQLLQTSDFVVIFNEMIHDARIVPLNGRPHLPPSIRQWMGDSLGHWDGQTLVIDTTNFTDQTMVQDPLWVAKVRGTSELLHVIERFTRVSADALLYEFTVDDPTIFMKPWTAVVPMWKTEERIFEYACHEGNSSMAGILGGVRAQEKEAAAKK